MIRSVDPRSGLAFGPPFDEADENAVGKAVARAAHAASAMASLGSALIDRGLTAAAAALDDDAEALVAIADAETALGRQRLVGEVARTTAQLRAFAALVRTGDHLDIVASKLPPGGPARDLRRMNVPLGVVGVFTASNFPFAFGAAGGDTASALAAGCPVIVKAHPGHPQTSELVVDHLRRSLTSAGFPDDAVQVVHGGLDTGRALVCHPSVAAIGFTGSTVGGRAITDLAARRAAPIPVFAEQGSINPVVLGPSAFSDVAAIARTIAASVTLGGGQFCTKPGLIVVPSEEAAAFVSELTSAVAEATPAFLLTERIHHQFVDALERLRRSGHELIEGNADAAGFAAPSVVVTVDAPAFLADASLRAEMFGPATVVVATRDVAELTAVLAALDGNLTGAVHGSPSDEWVTRAVAVLAGKVGRLVYGGVPTGVAVDAAMHHGGPYPASSSSQHTSVGTAAIRRFLRPLAYQDFPDVLLPPVLRDA